MANNVEHLFVYLCAIHMSSLEKSCNWIVSFVVELREFVYIIDISPLLAKGCAFSPILLSFHFSFVF